MLLSSMVSFNLYSIRNNFIKGYNLENLQLGYPNEVSQSTSYFIRLIHPISLAGWDFQRFTGRLETEQSCDWEMISGVTKSDSFLGKIKIGSVDGFDVYMKNFLHFTNENYLFFRIKDSIMQKFKALYFSPEKEEICLKMLSCEFVHFQPDIGFLSFCFTTLPQVNPIPLRYAIDINYHLPFLQHSFSPLIRRTKNQDRNIVEQKTSIPKLFQKAYESLLGRENSEHEMISIQDCWGKEEKFTPAGNLDRLFLMSYAVLGVSNEEWAKEKCANTRHFYHQITQWSKDYQHNVPCKIELSSPETTPQGIPTRFWAFLERGITCIGLGASEFERNNFLPKFRESNFFALILAWYFNILQNRDFAEITTEYRKSIALFPSSQLFQEHCRQACLEFKGLGRNFPSPEIVQKLQSSNAFNTSTTKKINDENRFCKTGHYWELTYDGKKVAYID